MAFSCSSMEIKTAILIILNRLGYSFSDFRNFKEEGVAFVRKTADGSEQMTLLGDLRFELIMSQYNVIEMVKELKKIFSHGDIAPIEHRLFWNFYECSRNTITLIDRFNELMKYWYRQWGKAEEDDTTVTSIKIQARKGMEIKGYVDDATSLSFSDMADIIKEIEEISTGLTPQNIRTHFPEGNKGTKKFSKQAATLRQYEAIRKTDKVRSAKEIFKLIAKDGKVHPDAVRRRYYRGLSAERKEKAKKKRARQLLISSKAPSDASK